MNNRIGTALSITGALMVAWALSLSLSMMLDFTNDEVKELFRQGVFIFGSAVVFAFIFRAKITSWGIVEKSLLYVVVPAIGLLLSGYAFLMQYFPETLLRLG